jgi:hypothetical protein
VPTVRADNGIARRKPAPDGLAAEGGVTSFTVGGSSWSRELVLDCGTSTVAGGLCDGAGAEGALRWWGTLIESCGKVLVPSPVAGRAVDGRGGKALVRVPGRALCMSVVSTGSELGAAGVSACCELGGLGATELGREVSGLCGAELGREVSGLCTGEFLGAISGLCTGELGCSASGSALTVCSVPVLVGRGLGGRGATGRWDANGRAALPVAGRTEGGAALGEPSCLNVLAGRTEGGVALVAPVRVTLLAIRAEGGASPGGTLLAECGAFRPILRAGAFDFSGATLGAGLSRESSLLGAMLGSGAPARDSVDAGG